METNVTSEAVKWNNFSKFKSYHDFNEVKVFVGYFKSIYESENKNTGECYNGYLFEDEQGNECLLGANYAIKKAVEEVPKAPLGTITLYRIEFKGKKKLTGGKSVNVFDIAYTYRFDV